MNNYPITDFPQTTSATTPRAEKLRDFFHSPIVWLVSGIILITTIIAILIIILSPKNNSYPVATDNKIKIDNLADVLSDMPDIYRDNIEHELYLQTSSDLLASPTPATATIRKDSLKPTYINDSLRAGDFIVDIPSVKFSYIVSYRYGYLEDTQIDPFASADIYCISENQMIYENSPHDYCFTEREYHPTDIITYLLPYDSEDGTYSLSWNYDSSTKSGYSVIIHYEPSKSDLATSAKYKAFEESTLEKIKSWLSSKGANLENYNFYPESEGEAL